MAEETIGLLRVVLASNSAEFVRDMGKSGTAIDAFARQGKAAGQTLANMVAGFNGSKLAGEASRVATAVESIGGASKLTETELNRVRGTLDATIGKFGLLGRDVPPEILKVRDEITKLDQAAGRTAAPEGGLGKWSGMLGTIARVLPGLSTAGAITAITGLATSALQAADKFVTLSEKTGASIETVQRWQFVADQTGTSVETFGNNAFKLGVNVAAGTDKVKSALGSLGLAYEELRSLKPEDQFARVIEKLEGVEDVTERNRLGQELFGRQFSEIAGAVAAGYTRIATEATVASDAQVRAAEAAGDAWERLKNKIAAISLGAVGRLASELLDTAASLDTLNESEMTAFTVAQRLGEGHLYLVNLQRERLKGQRDINLAVEAAVKTEGDYEKQVVRTATATKDVTTVGVAFTGLVSRSLTETAALTKTLERWAIVNGAVLSPSIRQVSADLQEQETLIATANTNWVGFAGTVTQQSGVAAQASSRWLQALRNAFGGDGQMQQFLLTMTQGFAGVFVGPGGLGEKLEAFAKQAVGHLKGFATQGLEALMGMIPGVGPWIKAFAAPIIEGLSKLAKKAADLLRGIFGGPSRQELDQREQVAAFEDSLHGALTAQQELESQGEDWRRTVIAIRDAYLAAGRTAEEAEDDTERLWRSSRDGGEDALAVIEEIKRKMRELTSGEHTIEVEVKYTGTAPPGAQMPGEPESHTQPVDPGFATGTMGRFGNWFRDFRNGFPTRLHGVEAVVPKRDAPAFAREVLGAEVGSGGVAVLPVIMGADRSPREIARDAINHLAKSGLPTNESGIASAIEAVIDNWFLTYARG